MSRVLFIVGAAGLVSCLFWWAHFYNAFLDVTGLKETTKDWMEAMQVYGQCLFWDTERCLSAKSEPKLKDYTPYLPQFIWVAAGLLIAGVVARARETWNAAGTRHPGA